MKKKAVTKKKRARKTKTELEQLIEKVHPRGVPKNVAIVAMGGSCGSYLRLANKMGTNRRLADEVWAVNSLGGVIYHDLLFQMDDLELQEARAKNDPKGAVAGTITWLKDHPKIMTSRACKDYPGAIEFPLDEAIKEFDATYFNGTVAYAMAWAIMIKVESVTLYGCDYSYSHMHKAESGRGCLEYYIGRATERGIKIMMPSDTSLMDTCVPNNHKIYGYDAYEITLERDVERKKWKVTKELRKELPSVEEMEERYKIEL